MTSVDVIQSLLTIMFFGYVFGRYANETDRDHDDTCWTSILGILMTFGCIIWRIWH